MKLTTTMIALFTVLFPAGLAPAQRDELTWKAHDFELTDTAGKKHRLSALGDRVVVLEWFSHECPFVNRHYAHTEKKAGAMQTLSAKYRKAGVVWLAIDSTASHSAADVSAAIKKMKVGHPVLLDADGKVGKLYGARTTPHVFVVRGGRILYQGAVDDGPRGNAKTFHLAEALDAVLAGKPVKKKHVKPYGCRIKYAKKRR